MWCCIVATTAVALHMTASTLDICSSKMCCHGPVEQSLDPEGDLGCAAVAVQHAAAPAYQFEPAAHSKTGLPCEAPLSLRATATALLSRQFRKDAGQIAPEAEQLYAQVACTLCHQGMPGDWPSPQQMATPCEEALHTPQQSLEPAYTVCCSTSLAWPGRHWSIQGLP